MSSLRCCCSGLDVKFVLIKSRWIPAEKPSCESTHRSQSLLVCVNQSCTSHPSGAGPRYPMWSMQQLKDACKLTAIARMVLGSNCGFVHPTTRLPALLLTSCQDAAPDWRGQRRPLERAENLELCPRRCSYCCLNARRPGGCVEPRLHSDASLGAYRL